MIEIKLSDEEKYLGLILDSKLKWKANVEAISKNARATTMWRVIHAHFTVRANRTGVANRFSHLSLALWLHLEGRPLHRF